MLSKETCLFFLPFFTSFCVRWGITCEMKSAASKSSAFESHYKGSACDLCALIYGDPVNRHRAWKRVLIRIQMLRPITSRISITVNILAPRKRPISPPSIPGDRKKKREVKAITRLGKKEIGHCGIWHLTQIVA